MNAQGKVLILAALTAGFVFGPSISSAQSASPLVWTGDARVRLHREVDMTSPTATVEDTKPRIRLRLGASTKINETVSAAFRFTTGSKLGAEGVTSDSQDLGELGGKKQFGLDLMYLNYKPMEMLDVQGGKVPDLFWTAGKNEMVWSSVTEFDGAQVRYLGGSDSLKPFAVVTYASEINRKSNAMADTNLLAAQIGTTYKAGDFSIAGALASYNFSNVKGMAITDVASDTKGNSVTAATYAYDYKLLDAGLEVAYNLGFAPLTAYVEYVQNSDPSDFNKGMIGGLRLGSLKDVGSWYVDYNYRDVQKDAVFAALADATFLNGYSGDYGHAIKVGYQLSTNVVTSLYYMAGQRPAKGLATTGNYELALLDLIASF